MAEYSVKEANREIEVASQILINSIGELVTLADAFKLTGNREVGTTIDRVARHLRTAYDSIKAGSGFLFSAYIGAVDEGSQNMLRAALAAGEKKR